MMQILFSVADPDPGSGFRCLFDAWIRDPVWVKKSRSGSGIRIRDQDMFILETIFCVKNILNSLMRIRDTESGIFLTSDPGWKKFESVIRDKHPGSATLIFVEQIGSGLGFGFGKIYRFDWKSSDSKNF
jgi:hypothetical protein